MYADIAVLATEACGLLASAGAVFAAPQRHQKLFYATRIVDLLVIVIVSVVSGVWDVEPQWTVALQGTISASAVVWLCAIKSGRTILGLDITKNITLFLLPAVCAIVLNQLGVAFLGVFSVGHLAALIFYLPCACLYAGLDSFSWPRVNRLLALVLTFVMLTIVEMTCVAVVASGVTPTFARPSPLGDYVNGPSAVVEANAGGVSVALLVFTRYAMTCVSGVRLTTPSDFKWPPGVSYNQGEGRLEFNGDILVEGSTNLGGDGWRARCNGIIPLGITANVAKSPLIVECPHGCVLNVSTCATCSKCPGCPVLNRDAMHSSAFAWFHEANSSQAVVVAAQRCLLYGTIALLILSLLATCYCARLADIPSTAEATTNDTEASVLMDGERDAGVDAPSSQNS